MLDSPRTFVASCDELRIGDCARQCRRLRQRRGVREVSIHEAIKECFAGQIHRLFAASAVEGKFDANPFRRQQFELVMKKYRVAAVTNYRAAVMQFSEEAMRHGGKSRRRTFRGAVHSLSRFNLQNLCITEMTVLQMRDHEARHIRHRRRAAARGPRHNQLIRTRWCRCRSIALRYGGGESFGQRLIEAGVRHAQRCQNMVFNVALEWLLRHALYDVAGQGRRSLSRLEPRRARTAWGVCALSSSLQSKAP